MTFRINVGAIIRIRPNIVKVSHMWKYYEYMMKECVSIPVWLFLIFLGGVKSADESGVPLFDSETIPVEELGPEKPGCDGPGA